ncbi:SpaA isopeptide-forming pilin-related protein [Lactiplantibacillus songbeiensis]|uniref:SpaA isopeptide-forming pilin-related protein n=1 Tax=Lactiplantibacillus songbeiensis TaxID=2559920 RepID=A0ABW4BZV4_9LACO|nr:SpaA isopeptide-forming pilin-related protein [Lactiplantibacillus songbeiensis]
MRLKTILAGTATLLTLMAANTVKAQAASQSTTATSDADTTATSSATTTKQVVTLHNSSADSSGGSNDTSNGTATNGSSSTSSSSASSSSVSSSSTSSSSTSSSSASSSSVSSSSTSSSSVSSSASSSSNSSSDDSSSSTPSASASSSSTPAPVSPVKADSTVKDATPDTTVSDVSSTANPAVSELNQQQLLVQSQTKSTSATLANSQLNTQMYSAVTTSQKGSSLANHLATGILPFASFKSLLARATLPIVGLNPENATFSNLDNTTISNGMFSGNQYKVIYSWSLPDGFVVHDGDQYTITLPDKVVFTAANAASIVDDDKNVIATFSAVQGSSTGILTFNDFYTTHLTGRDGNTFWASVESTNTSATGSSFDINKAGWPTKWDDEKNISEMTWNIVANPNSYSWNQVVITDSLGKYQSFNPDNLTVQVGSYDLKADKFTMSQDISKSVQAKYDGNVLTLNIGNITQALYIFYTVSVNEVAQGYSNSAKLSYIPDAGNNPGDGGSSSGSGSGDAGNSNNTEPTVVQARHDYSQGAGGTANWQDYNIVIKKVGSEEKPLSHALFSLYDSDGKTLLQSGLETNYLGQVTVTNVIPGDYYIQETMAPTGYLLDETLHKVTVVNADINLVVQDLPIAKTALNVKKIWSQVPTNVVTPAVTVTLYIKNADDTLTSTGQTLTLSSANNYQGTFSNLDATDAYGKTIIYTVVETVPTGYTSAQTTDGHQVTITNTYQTGTINIVKTGSDTKTALAGATFALVDGNGQIVKTGTTDNQGQLVFTDLNQGSYTLKETNAPAGYQLVADQTITVDYTNGYTANLAITDPVIPMTTITVNKHWANTQGKAVTSPVTMTLSANGKAVQTLILTAETGYTGQFTNLAMTTADGTPIVYTVSETPVAGYTMSGGQLVDGVVDFTNTLQTGSLTITKVDSQTQAALAGATFDLRDANGQLVQTGTTDAQGRLTFTGLVSGTYTSHEATAPTGYQLAADQMVTVDATSAKAAGITVADVAVPVIVVPPTTTITVNKHWVQVPASTTTPSVTVTLVANGTLTDQTLTLTAANGYTGQFTNLAVNDANDQAMTYTVVETPIAGYTTTGGNVVNGVADITNTWVKVPVIPTPTGSLQVIKVDATTKHCLAGAAFDLRDVSGNLVASGMTAENGQVMFNNLTYGTYQVVETTAPAGYDLNTKPQLVTIGETTMQSITVADTATVVPPVKPVVPVTPVTPTKPEQPRQPTIPIIPTKPVVPVKPEQPGYPDVVTVTVTPDQPAGVTFGEYYGGITPKQPQLTTVTKSSTDRPTVVTTTVTASAATVMPTKTATPKVAHQQLPQTNDATALWLKLLGLIGLLLSGLSYARFKRLD